MISDTVLQFIRSYITDNPILTRELRVLTRPKLIYRIITIYLLILLAGIFGYGPGLIESLDPQPPAVTVLTLYAWIQTIIVLFLAPAFTTRSIIKEYRTRTIEQTAIAGFSSVQIIVGKVLAATAVTTILIACGLPVIFCCIVFWTGGDWTDVFKVHLLCIPLGFAAAAMAIICSKPNKYDSLNVYALYILPAELIFILYMQGSSMERWGKLHKVNVHSWLASSLPSTVFNWPTINIAGQEVQTLTISFVFWLLVGITIIYMKASYVLFARSPSPLIGKITIFCLFVYTFWLIAGDQAFNKVTSIPGMAFGAIPYLIIYFFIFVERVKLVGLMYRDTVCCTGSFLEIFPKTIKPILFTIFLASASYVVAAISHILTMSHTTAKYSPFDMSYFTASLVLIITFVFVLKYLTLLSACYTSNDKKVLILPMVYSIGLLIAMLNYPSGGFSGMIPNKLLLLVASLVNIFAAGIVFAVAAVLKPQYRGIQEES